MTRSRPLALALSLAFAIPLAGCANFGDAPKCAGGEPVVTIASRLDPAKPRVILFDTTLHNCTDSAFRVTTDACQLRNGLIPSIERNGETFYLYEADKTIETVANPAQYMLCDWDAPVDQEVFPGERMERTSWWDGTFANSPAAAGFTGGKVTVEANAGPYSESVEITVPWS